MKIYVKVFKATFRNAPPSLDSYILFILNIYIIILFYIINIKLNTITYSY